MFEFMMERSDNKEYVVRCSQEGYSWICRVSKWGKTKLFKIRKIGSHTCASNVVLGSHRQLSSTVVSANIKYKYTSSRTIYASKDICSDMLHTYGIYLNYSKAWRSREQTLKMIRGDPTDSFDNIPSFFYMFRQKNPGTVTNLEVDSHKRFKYCFMALGALIYGWKPCRPLIVVDSTYLNGHYGCTLFINLKLHFEKSRQNVTQAFNSAVRTYTLEEFEYYMRQLDTMNQKISAYLADVRPEKWSQIHITQKIGIQQ
ncbi:uncharacterized protein LOC111379868 [Olea europaea var. sylvestris]|uniref:uncharacterized protein LOC111379868 n=1 Tax=Olea europaea var. sylvestris TaxID=158386 RepID=UPI000C1D0778|nr:uncharacterized protein LOC111379868 [Olea europaea var. sylvestris]